MSRERFVKAEELANELGVSKPFAYKLIREMNEELQKQGFITISGRVSRQFFEEKFYGLRQAI
jgi:Mn-dependent DtxR family transcriptional regulator